MCHAATGQRLGSVPSIITVHVIWQFCDVLARSLVIHAAAYPDVPQYFFMPQSGQLDLLYNSLGKHFEKGRYGSTFRCVTRPAQDKGGFYGFERA